MLHILLLGLATGKLSAQIEQEIPRILTISVLRQKYTSSGAKKTLLFSRKSNQQIMLELHAAFTCRPYGIKNTFSLLNYSSNFFRRKWSFVMKHFAPHSAPPVTFSRYVAVTSLSVSTLFLGSLLEGACISKDSER